MRVLIVGAGAVGYHLASRLAEEAQEVTIIDLDPAKVQHAADNLDVLAIRGSGSDPPTLMEAGLARTDILVAVSGVDEVNLLACLVAERHGVRVKIARNRHPEHFGPGGPISARELGVDLMISPEQECAEEIFQLLAVPAATDLARFARGRVLLLGMRVLPDAPLTATSLEELGRRLGGRRFVVAAVLRGDATLIPGGSTRIREGDKVFVLAPSDEIAALPPLAGHEFRRIRRVIIAGGSDEAVHLARELAVHGVQATVVERNRGRARELSELLPRTLVLEGDATDLELLEMEGVEGVDGFVSLTDRDEVNMLVALLAKGLGARKVIPLIHRAEYMELVDRVGLDAAVSPRISAANTILRHVRRGPVASIATVKGSRAEALEAVVKHDAPIAGRQVREIRFPAGALLGLLVRGDEVIMPHGGDRILPGDHAVFFVLPEGVAALAKLLE